MNAETRRSSRVTTPLMVTGEVVGFLVQGLLVVLGWSIVSSGATDTEQIIIPLVIWCIVASAYLGAVIVLLNILARRHRDESRPVRALIAHPVARAFAVVTTFLSSLIGLTVAIDLIVSLGLDVRDVLFEICAVWAMLLSWAMFNWGFSRIYYSRYHRGIAHEGSRPALEFPGTTTPRLVDFVYFSFTNATAFSVSDVQVTTTRMRWTVVWHTSLAFFFNALIIVLSMNIIASGQLIERLFE